MVCMDIVSPQSPIPTPPPPAGYSDAGSMDDGGYPRDFVTSLQTTIDEHGSGASAALILISLNNLPMIISGFGHQESEEAILKLTSTLKELLQTRQNSEAECNIFRIQKDQLAIIIEDKRTLTFDNHVQDIGRHIQAFGYESSYGTIHILASIASVTLPESTVSASEIVNQAYVAVKNCGGIQSNDFEPVLSNASNSRKEMNMVNYITKAIKDGQFCMAFQPIISSSNGEIAYYEALLRLMKDDGDLATAGPLIPIAERMGLIDIIDELVLEMIVEDLRNDPALHVSFNVSNLTANSTAWLNKFNQIAKEHPEIVSRMMVEITETAVHLDLRRTAYFVAAIQAQGAKVALDDFGSGYTSFRQLKTLSVDVVKIDGIFIRDLVTNHDNHLFIKTMLDFTNGFGLETVAEFVENGETAKMLMDLGVNYMQGYYFGFPEVRRILGQD